MFMHSHIWKRAASLFFIGLITIVLTACGGGGGGGGGGGLSTGTFEKTDERTGTSWSQHFGTTFNGIRYLHLYQVADILGAGYISALRLQANSAVAASFACANVTIRMGHSSAATTTGTYADVETVGQGSPVTVLDDATITIPAMAQYDYWEIPLATNFYYNGIDNIFVDISRAGACGGTTAVRAGNTATTVTIGSVAGPMPATGSNQTALAGMRFVFSGGDNTIDLGGGSTNFWPFTNQVAQTQNLYLASEINGSGPITGLGFQLDAATTVANTYTYTVRMGHSTLATLNNDFTSNFSGTPNTVADNLTFTIPAGMPAGAYFWVPLTSSFNYNGTDNLIIDVAVPSGTGDTDLRVAPIAGRRVSDNIGDNTPSLGAVAYHIRLRMNGSTMDVIGPDNGQTTMFSTSVDGRQFMLRAAELGTSGTINRIACRIYSASVAQDYMGYKVVMAHSSASTLDAVDANNTAGGSTVFSGTFSLPAGLRNGDWVEIPLSNSFSYNGTDNLVVETSTTIANVGTSHLCEISGPNATSYPGLSKVTGGAAPLDYRGTWRFWINK